MKRTQIQLEEELFEQLRYQAFRERRSLAGVIRHILRERVLLPFPSQRKARSLTVFSFVGSGASRGLGAGSISEKHDKELSKALAV